MKIIRNGICYIEKDDILAIDELNDCVLEEINWKESYSSFFKISKFENQESVSFFQRIKFIPDYDAVKDLQLDELGSYIKIFADRMKNTDNFGQKYYLQSLVTYFDNKELYDKAFSALPFDNFIKRVKLNYRSEVGHTKPVMTIPISSAKIQELDRSIHDKCKQNRPRNEINDGYYYAKK